jgi:hypothetical protein
MLLNEMQKHDKRTIERHIKLGVVEEKEHEKFLKSLPDVADKAMPVEVVMDEFFDDQVDVAE